MDARSKRFEVYFTHYEGLTAAETESVTGVPEATVEEVRRPIDDPQAPDNRRRRRERDRRRRRRAGSNRRR